MPELKVNLEIEDDLDNSGSLNRCSEHKVGQAQRREKDELMQALDQSTQRMTEPVDVSGEMFANFLFVIRRTMLGFFEYHNPFFKCFSL